MIIFIKTNGVFKDKPKIACFYKLPKVFIDFNSLHWNNFVKKNCMLRVYFEPSNMCGCKQTSIGIS